MREPEFVVDAATQDVVITREFAAPRELVFRALTDPALVARWWGPKSYETVVNEYDARPGGRWRIVHRDADGSDHGFHGVFHEVSPERVVRTFEYEGAPGHVLLESATLEDLGGRTLMRIQSVYQSTADRRAMVDSGMEWGVRESYERLDVLLDELA